MARRNKGRIAATDRSTRRAGSAGRRKTDPPKKTPETICGTEKHNLAK
jgi:hypothetical protein